MSSLFLTEAGDSCVSHFNWFPQTLRAGHARQSLKAQTLTSCLNFCINSLTRYSFTCLAVMYYYDLEQCVLHTDNIETNSNVKGLLQAASLSQQVDYFEAFCHSSGGKIETVRNDIANGFGDERGIAEWSNWSEWTSCGHLDSHQIRNRTCLTSTSCKGSEKAFKSCP